MIEGGAHSGCVDVSVLITLETLSDSAKRFRVTFRKGHEVPDGVDTCVRRSTPVLRDRC